LLSAMPLESFDVDLRFQTLRTELDRDFLFLIVKVNLKPRERLAELMDFSDSRNDFSVKKVNER